MRLRRHLTDGEPRCVHRDSSDEFSSSTYEVSDVVRCQTKMCRQILIKLPSIRSYENPYRSFRGLTRPRSYRHICTTANFTREVAFEVRGVVNRTQTFLSDNLITRSHVCMRHHGLTSVIGGPTRTTLIEPD